MSKHNNDSEAKKATDNFEDCWIAHVKKNMPDEIKKRLENLIKNWKEWLLNGEYNE